jgi:hypothetical protein
MMKTMERHTTAAMTLVALAIAGCAINPYPEQQLASAEAAVNSAREAASPQTSGPELRLAGDKLKLGQRWIGAKDYKPAVWLLEQAQVDAELASMRAMSARALHKVALAGRELRERTVRTVFTSN